jgi:hypothetical protein
MMAGYAETIEKLGLCKFEPCIHGRTVSMPAERRGVVLGYAGAAMHRLLGLLTVAFFVLFVAELSPHLVHHLFDDHQGATQASCPFATVAERQHPDTPVVVDIERGHDRAGTANPASETPVRSFAVAVGAARAPPAVSA